MRPSDRKPDPVCLGTSLALRFLMPATVGLPLCSDDLREARSGWSSYESSVPVPVEAVPSLRRRRAFSASSREYEGSPFPLRSSGWYD